MIDTNGIIFDFDFTMGDAVLINYVDQDGVSCQSVGQVVDEVIVDDEKYYAIFADHVTFEKIGLGSSETFQLNGQSVALFHPDELEPFQRFLQVVIDNTKRGNQ